MKGLGQWVARSVLFALLCVLLAASAYALLVPGGIPWRAQAWGRQIEIASPSRLGLLLLVPVLFWVLLRSLVDLPWPQRALAFSLRVTFLALLALGLSGLVQTKPTHRVCTVALLDVSESVSDAALEEARQKLQGLVAARGPDDQLRLVVFAERPAVVPLLETELPNLETLRRAARPKEHGARAVDSPNSGTNIQAALELGYGVMPTQCVQHALIFSDGIETEGDILAEASLSQRRGVRLFVVPYRLPPPGEVSVRGLRLPDQVAIGEPFQITAEVYSSRRIRGTAELFQGEVLNGLDARRDLTLEPGVTEIQWSSVVRVGGEVTYTIKLKELEQDHFPDNNEYSVNLDVPRRPSVLYIEGEPERANLLSAALRAQQYEVETRTPQAFPGSLAELEQYDLLVMSDTPREALSAGSEALIERYVRDLGGGFVFAGGESGYGLGGWSHSNLERILPVRMEGERHKEMPQVALSLLIDRSGSMTGLPIEMAKAACKATLSTLEGDDLIEVIAFDSTPVRYVKAQPARYRSRIQNDIQRIQPGGGTEIFASLDMAYQDLAVVQARKKHVILLTDGQAPTQGIKDLVSAMIADSITVTTVGLGDGANQDLLRMIADTGGGRFHSVPDPNSLPKIFTREAEMIGKKAAVEDWFSVQVVNSVDFLKDIGIQAAPLLRGYVATQMKPPPAQLILASESGDPILARLRVGLGWTLAWTSDVKSRWAVDWVRWSGFSKFWGQLVREHMRHKRRQEGELRAEMIGSTAQVTLDAFTVDERFDNGLRSELSLIGPGKTGKRREFELHQIAPGRYQARFPLQEYGPFLLRAEQRRVSENGEVSRVGTSSGHLTYPYPPEYANFEPDLERLSRVAEQGGGTVDPDVRAVFDPGAKRVPVRHELWKHLVLGSIAIFLLDLTVRRVRLFERQKAG